MRQYYQIHDNVEYFLDAIDRVADNEYEPSWEDYLRIQTRSTGFSSTTIETNPWLSKVCKCIHSIYVYISLYLLICKLKSKNKKFDNEKIEIVDVGGTRSERKKWLKVSRDGYDLCAVIFVVAIGDYDLTLFEDNSSNRLCEAFNLFIKLAERGFFNGSKMYIFFNKYDIFQQKLQHIPITVALRDFPSNKNPNDEEDVVTFIASKFRDSLLKLHVKVRDAVDIHRTNALDDNLMKNVLEDVFNQLLGIKVESEY